MSSTNVTPVPAPDNSAPQIAAPAPPTTMPDLSSLSNPGAAAQPNAQTAAQGSAQQSFGQAATNLSLIHISPSRGQVASG